MTFLAGLLLLFLILWCGGWLWLYASDHGNVAIHLDTLWTSVGLRANLFLGRPISPQLRVEWWTGYAVSMLLSYVIVVALLGGIHVLVRTR